MKNRYIALFLSLGLPIFLTGCDFQPTEPSQDFNNQLVTRLNDYLRGEQIRYYCLANEQEYKITITDDLQLPPLGKLGECTQSPDPGGPIKARGVRNEIIERGVSAIDANYAQYISDLNLGRSTGNFLADTVELTTSGVIGALNGPSETLRILGVGLSTFQGARSSFDLNYFDKQTTAILVNQMDSNRAKAYELILYKKDLDITQYPMAEAIKDVVAYYNAGTLVRAFSALSQQTAANSQAWADEIRILQGVPISDPVTIDTRNEAKNAYKTLQILERSLSSSDPQEREVSLTKLNKILSELINDQDFQVMKTEKSLIVPSVPSSDGKSIVQFLRTVKAQANREPKFAALYIKINQKIVYFGQ